MTTPRLASLAGPLLLAGRYGRSFGAAALLSLGVALLNACAEGKQVTAPPPAPEVSVVEVRLQSVPVTIELPGRTNPYRTAQVRARVDGIVLRREFTEGSDVKAGQRLYKIDPAPYQAALDAALGTLANAEAAIASTTAQAERFKVLAAANAIARQDHDNAVAARDQAIARVASARAAVQTARINLGYTDVVAPISGRIGISQVTEGAYVQAGQATLMATVQQIDPIYADLTQSSAEGLRLRSDVASGRIKLHGPSRAKVALVLEDGAGYPQAATLQFTDITVDQATGSVTLRSLVPNPQQLLLPGMYVRARIDAGVNDDAVLVPQAGVTRDPKGQATALVVGSDDKVQVRPIRATRTLGENWVVEGGLVAGERVIVSGVQKVQPGMAVRAVSSQARAPSERIAVSSATR